MTGGGEHPAPSVDRCYELIEVLSSAWSANREPVRVTTRVELPFAPVVFGHVAHTVQLSTAVADLHQAERGLAMMPLVRQVIECSIRAVWLEQYRENVRAVIHDGQRQRKAMLDSAVKAAWLTRSDEAGDDADHAIADDGQATSGRSFERICSELDGGERQYALYRLASALTHPGPDLVEHYLEPSSEVTSGIRFVPDPPLASADAWLGITAQHTLVAVYAWDRVEAGRPYRSALRAWAEEFGVNRGQPGMTPTGFQAWNRAATRRRRARKSTASG